MATLLVEHSSYYDEKHNLYAMNRAQLASWLRIKHPENVRRYVAALIKAGWLVVCEPGHNGRQQTYHRSIPWDSVRSWNRRWHPDCPICHFKRALPDNPDQALTCGNICDLTK